MELTFLWDILWSALIKCFPYPWEDGQVTLNGSPSVAINLTPTTCSAFNQDQKAVKNLTFYTGNLAVQFWDEVVHECTPVNIILHWSHI